MKTALIEIEVVEPCATENGGDGSLTPHSPALHSWHEGFVICRNCYKANGQRYLGEFYEEALHG